MRREKTTDQHAEEKRWTFRFELKEESEDDYQEQHLLCMEREIHP